MTAETGVEVKHEEETEALIAIDAASNFHLEEVSGSIETLLGRVFDRETTVRPPQQRWSAELSDLRASVGQDLAARVALRSSPQSFTAGSE